MENKEIKDLLYEGVFHEKGSIVDFETGSSTQQTTRVPESKSLGPELHSGSETGDFGIRRVSPLQQSLLLGTEPYKHPHSSSRTPFKDPIVKDPTRPEK